MKILIAPDSFKGSLTALEAAQAIHKGLLASKLKATCHLFPIADGGEGSLDVVLSHTPGETKTITVEDAVGRPIQGVYGLVNEGRTAVIELAKASGIQLLNTEELDPLCTSTFGTGQLMADALKQNVKEIILAIGGSATVDGGAGILDALGVKLLNRSGNAIPKGGRGLMDVAAIGDIPEKLRETQVTILCDVENPLLGNEGAAAVFGPQKGANAGQVKKLEAGLRQFCEVIKNHTGTDVGQIIYGGASGGVAAGLHSVLGAKLVPGLTYLLELADIDTVLRTSSLVITGEGRFDRQSVKGKGPWGLAKKAKESNLPVILLAGQVARQYRELTAGVLDAVLAINTDSENPGQDLKSAADNLATTARWVGNILAMGQLHQG